MTRLRKTSTTHRNQSCRLLACACLFVIMGVPSRGQTDLTVYQPVGVAANSQTLLVSTPDCNPGNLVTPPLNLPRQILAFDSSGGPSRVFSDLSGLPGASVPCSTAGGSGFETYLAISPGLGGFPAGEVYVLLLHRVYKIPPAGGRPSLFATLPERTHGLVFDTVGNFGFNLIVTTRISNTESAVYLVAANGQVSAPLVTLTTLLEGPAIAPANFGTISQGDLVVADQHRGRVLDVKPTGNVSTFASGFIVPEGVHFIPQQVCAFYNAEEQNNLSSTPSLVKFYDASFFAGHEGQMLVRSELDPANTGNNIYAVDTSGNATILGKAQGQQEGAAFVSSCGMSCVSELLQLQWQTYPEWKLHLVQRELYRQRAQPEYYYNNRF